MRRRGPHSDALSLFAFQDIMASIIGMLFFIVLLLSFDITHKVDSGNAEVHVPTEQELTMAKAAVARLQADVRQAEAEAAETVRVIGTLAKDDRVMLAEVKRLDETLKSFYAQIAGKQRGLSEAKTRVANAESERASRLEELLALRRQLAEVQKKLAEKGNSPRVTYIIDPRPDHLRPWLVEVTGARYRVASKEGTGAVLEFSNTEPGPRKKQLLDWCDGQDKSKYYFVVLIKPSGHAAAREILRGLHELGFDVGLDILPESWDPF